jgi:hypothetical protein
MTRRDYADPANSTPRTSEPSAPSAWTQGRAPPLGQTGRRAHQKERTCDAHAFVARDYDETLRALGHPPTWPGRTFVCEADRDPRFVVDGNSNSEAPARPVRSVPGLRVAAEPGWGDGLRRHGQRPPGSAATIIQRSRSPFPFTARAILASSCSTAPPRDTPKGARRPSANKANAHHEERSRDPHAFVPRAPRVRC